MISTEFEAVDTMTLRICPECSEPISGRADKLYCSDRCRNTRNNRLNRDNTNFMRTVSNRLRKNSRLIKELLKAGKQTVAKSEMVKMGFDFAFITEIVHTKQTAAVRFCFNFGYQFAGAEYCLLFERSEIVKPDE